VIGTPAAMRPTSDERRVADGGRGVGGVLARDARDVDQHLHRAGLARIAAEIAAELELVELVGHARQRLQADRIPDLAHARRVAVARDGALDDLEDRHLLVTEALATTRLRPLGAFALSARSVGHESLLSSAAWQSSSNVGGR